MKIDVILAGVGGQGILTIAAIIGTAALKNGLYLKQAETHGMSQRGGAVVSHLRISDTPIASDLIPMASAEVIISVEPMESLRYLHYLDPKGYLITNSTIVDNIPDYPDFSILEREISKLPHALTLPADEIAAALGNSRGSNLVMLGAASPVIKIPDSDFEEAIVTCFAAKGDQMVKANLDAYRAGRDYATSHLQLPA